MLWRFIAFFYDVLRNNYKWLLSEIIFKAVPPLAFRASEKEELVRINYCADLLVAKSHTAEK